jgi:lipopolysaccharide biosynthesis glycosyltransferase
MGRKGKMKENIKIFISCHKKCYIPKHDLLYPIQVGAINSKERFEGMLHDDEGDNISAKNQSYCELTAQYWAWKNEDADYYGFFHYRRYMSFAKEQFPHNKFQDVEMDYLTDYALEKLNLDKAAMINKINQYDVIATPPVNLPDLSDELHNNFDQYVLTPYQYKEDIEVLLDIIKEKYPEYYHTAYHYFYKQKYGYYCNMFIMTKELFCEYSEWLFTILEEHEKRRDYSNYTVEGKRISGYLGERLFGIYYMHLLKQKKYKTCELQRTLFQNVNVPDKITPAFSEKNVPIVIATNDYYAPYISTLLLSIKQHSSDENNYDILVLSHDIKDSNVEILKNTLKDKDNFSLRFTDPGVLMDGYDLYTRGHFSVETYYRLVLPEMLKDYDKILYIDVDMIAVSDLAELYGTDVEGYLLAAAYDPDTAGLYNGYQPDKKEYMDKELNLENPYHYFQAGTLLMNLKEFRKTYTTKEILDVAVSKEWQLLDQDILNKLCEHRVKIIDMSWNVMYDYAGVRIKGIIKLAPEWLYKEYMEARKHPKIIHYAGPEKPWLFPEGDFADIYWEYAKQTPYYEMMLYRMACYAANREFEVQNRRKRSNSRIAKSPIYKTIRCLWLYGLKHTVDEIKREMKRI